MTAGDLAAIAAGIGVVWTVGYLVACRIWPYTSCRRCKGHGRFRSPSGRAWRHCRRCKGSGSRVRTGRRIWNGLTAVKDKAAG